METQKLNGDFFREFSGDEELQNDPISIKQGVVHQTYALSVYEMMKNQNPSTSAAIKEAQARMFTPIRQPKLHFFIDMEEIKLFEKVDFDGDALVVPIPHHDYLQTWNKNIRAYEEALNEQAAELSQFRRARMAQFYSATKAHEEFPPDQQISPGTISTRNAMLTVILKEKCLKQELEELAENCNKVEIQPDPCNGGIWITRQKESVASFRTPVMSVPSARKLNFDAITTQFLVQIQFSVCPQLRAQAKLNLNSKIDADKMIEVFNNPDALLAIAVAEARLTPLEVMSVIFPKHKGSDAFCLRCLVPVSILDPIYHRRCKTVKWLVKYQPFKYDDSTQRIVPISRAYLTPEHRYRLCSLLELHAQLNGDIVIKSGAETKTLIRYEDGKLRLKSGLPVIEAEEQVGTLAWRKKFGFTPE